MVDLDSLAPYADADGNEVVPGAGEYAGKVEIVFRGSNNRLEVADGARFRLLRVVFDCSNGSVVIGRSGRAGNATWSIRVGEDAEVVIGEKVTTTGRTSVSAVEGTRIAIGDDVMISSDVRVRGDDGHAIFDVRSGKRVNPARDITIGNHVWLGLGCSVLGGASIGSGSVVGTRSVVTAAIPNNCVAVGAPARVVRRDIAWERPHLSFDQPPFKPDVSVLRRKSRRYWNLTRVTPDRPPSARSLSRRVVGMLVRWAFPCRS
jgi:acetyltransferase-like isoleucine patch superfamily enzyme